MICYYQRLEIKYVGAHDGFCVRHEFTTMRLVSKLKDIRNYFYQFIYYCPRDVFFQSYYYSIIFICPKRIIKPETGRDCNFLALKTKKKTKSKRRYYIRCAILRWLKTSLFFISFSISQHIIGLECGFTNALPFFFISLNIIYFQFIKYLLSCYNTYLNLIVLSSK